jgi:uncharacterized protein YhdP
VGPEGSQKGCKRFTGVLTLDPSNVEGSAKPANDWAEIFEKHQKEWKNKKLADLFEQLDARLERLQLFLQVAKSFDWQGKRQQAVMAFYAVAAEATALLLTLPEAELRLVAQLPHVCRDIKGEI